MLKTNDRRLYKHFTVFFFFFTGFSSMLLLTKVKPKKRTQLPYPPGLKLTAILVHIECMKSIQNFSNHFVPKTIEFECHFIYKTIQKCLIEILIVFQLFSVRYFHFKLNLKPHNYFLFFPHPFIQVNTRILVLELVENS